MANSDLTSGPIWRPMLQIGVPVAIGMVFNTLYAITDTYFAGKISTEAMAGLGMTFPVYLLIMAIGIGIGQGTTALISTLIGAKQSDKVAETLGQAISLSVLLGSLVALVVFFYGEPILSFLVNDQELIAAGMPYVNVIVWAAPFMAFGMVANGALTAEGNAKPYRNIVIVGFFINLVLDPIFALDSFWGIPGLGLGLAGIGLATVLIQVLSAVVMLIYVRRSAVAKAFRRIHFVLTPAMSAKILNQGFAAALNMLLIAVGALILQRLIAPYGAEAVAGQTVGLRINQLFLLPLIGLSSALMAMTGQARGAGLGKRVLAIYAQLNFWGVIGMLVFGVLIAFTAPIWSGLFSTDPEVQRLTILYLYATVPMMPVWCFVFLSQSYSQGLQKPWPATIVNVLRQIPFPFVFVALVTFIFGGSALGVWIGIAVGNVIGALMMTAYVVWIAPRILGVTWRDTDLKLDHSAS